MQNQSFNEKAVNQDRKGCEHAPRAQSVRAPQLSMRRREQFCSLEPGVAVLCHGPVRERLAVIVIDGVCQTSYVTHHIETLCMTILMEASSVAPT